MTDIYKGDRLYHNNFSTRMHQSMPDYLIVVSVKDDLVEAKYENHYVYTKERTFSKKNLIADSNLNPKAKNPSWVFLGKGR